MNADHAPQPPGERSEAHDTDQGDSDNNDVQLQEQPQHGSGVYSVAYPMRALGFAVGVSFGSSVEIALFVSPLMVIVG